MALVGSAARGGICREALARSALALRPGARLQSTLPAGVVTTEAPRENKSQGEWPFLPFVRVPATEKWVTEKGGTYARTIGPGTSFLTPFLEKVVYKGPARSQLVDVGKVGAFCRDGGHAMAEAAVAYRVDDMQTMYYSVQDHARFIRLSARMVLANVLAKRTVLDGLQDRTAISKEVTEELNQALQPMGLLVETVLVTDYQPEPLMATALQAACTDRLAEEQQLEFQERRQEEKLRLLKQAELLDASLWKADRSRLEQQRDVDKETLETFVADSKPLIEELAPLMEKPGAAAAASFLVEAYKAIGKRPGLGQSVAASMLLSRESPLSVQFRPPGIDHAGSKKETDASEAPADEATEQGMSLADLEEFEKEYEQGREEEVLAAAEQQQSNGAEEMTREEAERIDLELQKQKKAQAELQTPPKQ